MHTCTCLAHNRISWKGQEFGLSFDCGYDCKAIVLNLVSNKCSVGSLGRVTAARQQSLLVPSPSRGIGHERVQRAC